MPLESQKREPQNRGRFACTAKILPNIAALLPYNCEVVGISGNPGFGCEVIIESPDMPPLNADGSIPVVEMDCMMHYGSKEKMVPALPQIMYATSIAWRHKPEKKYYRLLPIASTQGFGVKTDADAAQTFANAENTVLQTVQETADFFKGDRLKDWPEYVAALPEEARNGLLVQLLEAWFGYLA